MKKVEAADLPTRKTPLIRGKYTNLLRQGTNIAILDPDVVDHFPDSASVNDALRTFLAMREQFASLTSSARRPVRRVAANKTLLAFDPRTGLKNHKVIAAR